MQACDLFSRDRRPGIHKKGISVGQHEIAESRDALGTQELQGSRPRKHQPFEVATDFVGQMFSETRASGKPPIQPGGDLAHTRQHGLQCSKMLPTASQTNPYKCHKSRQLNI